MTQHQPTINRRLERHRRMDGNLQARARPVSFVRKAVALEEQQLAAHAIREWVEDRVDGLEKRLLFGGDDSGSSSDGGKGSSNRQSGAGAGAGSGDGSGSTTSTGSSDSVPSNVGGRPGGFDTSTTSATSTRSKSDPLGIFTAETTRSTTSSSSRTTSSSSTRSTSTSTSSQVSTVTPTSKTIQMLPSTSVAYVTSSPLPTLDSAAASPSATSQSNDSGPGAGPIIGIVAGVLAGVAVLAAIIGFIIKRKSRKEDPYESDPFDRDSFRRQSAMLPDTFEDDEFRGPEMSEAHHNMGGHPGPFADEHEYMHDGGAAVAGGGIGAAAAFTARNEAGGPRPPTMFQRHMNAPAAQRGFGGDQSAPAIYAAHGDPTPQLPTMAFGGSDPYTLAGVGRPNNENINNPYPYLDRSKSGSARASPPHHDQFVEAQEYANLDRHGSQGSQQQQQQHHNGDEDYSFGQHDTAGRPGTAEGRSGTPDLPNMQQTYAMGHTNMDGDNRVVSPHHMMASPQHMSQDFLSNGMQQRTQQQHHQQDSGDSIDQYASFPNPPQQQPLQVRNLLPNPHEQLRQQRGQRPVSELVEDDAAYDGVW